MKEIPCPSYEEIKKLKKYRAFPDSEEQVTISVSLKTITPILGGGTQNRKLDEVDIIRVPTIRGHLRFWWRALHGKNYPSLQELKQAEHGIWGGMGVRRQDEPQRSKVEVRVENITNYKENSEDISLSDKEGYVLWPARAEKNKDKTIKIPAAHPYKPDLQFTLHVTCPKSLKPQIENTIKAWILFGGYGSRTRRGVGSLTVTGAPEEIQKWLPRECSRKEFERLLGVDVFAVQSDIPSRQFPVLQGARIWAGTAQNNSHDAWCTAISWLQDFRQKPGPNPSTAQPSPYARNQGSTGKPGRSNWPEPDKVRHIRDCKSGHSPRYNSTPAFPRAGFGLPIVCSAPNARAEFGGNFEIVWYDRQNNLHERLASPLIIKALPLANGKFVPFAIWLNRKYPDGQVGLKDKPQKLAPFDRLIAPNDEIKYKYLRQNSLQDAFAEWLSDHQIMEVK